MKKYQNCFVDKTDNYLCQNGEPLPTKCLMPTSNIVYLGAGFISSLMLSLIILATYEISNATI